MIRLLGLTMLLLVGCQARDTSVDAASGNESRIDNRPNILLIIADDLGYTDLGAFGGADMHTPNLDTLAAEGLRLANFYAAPTCSPTRAMLMSGADSHRAGLGDMRERMPLTGERPPGYEGYLNDRVLTLPALLQDLGYTTMLSGKWHLGHDYDIGPWARGFDRSFAALSGVHNHYGDSTELPTTLWEYVHHAPIHWQDGVPVEDLPDYFYSSNYFTDRLVGFIHENKSSGKPFFGVLSFTAPHWPLQAPAEAYLKYEGQYDDGYEALRDRRIAGMRRAGLLPDDAPVAPLPASVPSWNSMPDQEKAYYGRAMEIYAAMVEILDWNVGRLLDYLARTNLRDNTVIVFLSDNGPDAASRDEGVWPDYLTRMDGEPGGPESFVLYGPGWAAAGSAGLRGTKSSTLEGGIRVPAIVAGPAVTGSGRLEHAVLTVRDILPTVVELAGSDVESLLADTDERYRPDGKSFVSLLQGSGEQVHADDEVLGWETSGRRAVRLGNWKLTSVPESDAWHLFDLANDPGESTDLAESEPAKYADMLEAWQMYAERNDVRH